MIRTFGIALVLVVALATTAHAQRSPDMATLDRGDGITKVGVDLGLTFLEHPPYDMGLRLEPYGQIVLDSGLGFYGAIPISMSFGGDENPQPPLPRDATALGNADLGLLYVLATDPAWSLVFRGGVAVPTASGGFDESATNAYASFPRMTDIALAHPDAWYIRIGVSPLVHVNKLFLRADLGFDLGLDDDGADELVRLNVGAGVDLDMLALSLELVNIGNLDADDWNHGVAVTMRFMGEQLQPFLSVGTPLDDGLRDAVELWVSGGLQVAF
jgi:hypothetical protein